eukprot:TRINITY_DN2539_c0_g1_i2.p1 TRINITY_DN2539_c0_g1~~TRINITY_DN2539_c0_g1_i2.p1  ORF type:complete len:499 (+),score=128.22 TRINITY_DN2539_c0_g1_i2:73-1569(+)
MADYKKGQKMSQKTEYARREFSLPDTESVIQDYRSYLRPFKPPGKLMVTQNYMLWFTHYSSSREMINFSKVKNIRLDSEGIFSSGIAVELESNPVPYFFSGFMHKMEAYNLLVYLWHHPVSYIRLDDIPDELPETTSNDVILSNDPDPSQTNAYLDLDARPPSATTSPRPASVAVAGGGFEQEQITEEVDLEASALARQRALEARQITQDTMEEISQQGEIIDDIEHDVERVHNQLDKSNRHLRGIESVHGTLANKVIPVRKSKEYGRIDRTIKVAEKNIVEVIYILNKLPSCDLVPATLHLATETLYILNESKTERTNEPVFRYDCIQQVVIRARPQHLDIRFESGKGSRLRLVTSYLQWVVSELHSRAPNTLIVFENNATMFDYKDPRIRLRSVTNRKGGSFGGGSKGSVDGVFMRPHEQDAFVEKAPDKVKAALEQQDQDLDDVADALADMKGMALAMGDTLDQQTAQIQKVNKRVAEANDRVEYSNVRMSNILV